MATDKRHMGETRGDRQETREETREEKRAEKLLANLSLGFIYVCSCVGETRVKKQTVCLRLL